MVQLKIRKTKTPTAMWPNDVDIDVQLDPVTGEYRDVVRFQQAGQADIIICVKHGGFANIANELEMAKQEYFP